MYVELLKPGNREVQNPNDKGGQTWCQLRLVGDLLEYKAPNLRNLIGLLIALDESMDINHLAQGL